MTTTSSVQQNQSSVTLAEDPRVIAFKCGMRKLASGVALITSAHNEIKAGLIATAVNSVSTEPPTLLVCVNKSASAHEVIDQSKHICVNLLSTADLGLVDVFGKPSRREERFKTGEWQTLPSGVPMLESALAAFSCKVVQQFSYETHTIFLGEVESVNIDEPGVDPLLYMDRAFRKLENID